MYICIKAYEGNIEICIRRYPVLISKKNQIRYMNNYL